MRLPRISTSIRLPDTLRTMPSAPNDVTKTVCPTSGGALERLGVRFGRLAAGDRPSPIASSAARASARKLADFAGREDRRACGRTALGRVGERIGFGLEPRDHGVDFGARFAQLLVQLVVEPPLRARPRAR